MNSHELARKLLENPDLPVELWVQDTPTSAINGPCQDVEVSEDETTIQLSTWNKDG